MISGLIFETLRDLVDNRCYPNTFPQPPERPVWPAIRYTIAVDANVDLCRNDNVDETDEYTAQIDVVAQSYGAAKALRNQVVDALAMLEPPAVREFERETYDTDTKTHRVILEYSFHQSTPQVAP